MMVTKGIWKTRRPTRTPIVDMITDDRMMTGFTTELNWVTRIRAISIRAIIALPVRTGLPLSSRTRRTTPASSADTTTSRMARATPVSRMVLVKFCAAWRSTSKLTTRR